jgi:LmbE family N-acetylglucosaminyl deacetylase
MVKPKEAFEFVRLVENERRVGPTLASVSRHWKQQEQRFLFLSPHDDDVIIGGGLMLLSALAEKVPVHVAVVTDGAMGYCSRQQKDSISEIRRKETIASFQSLGVERQNIHWLGFPDCQLVLYQGRRPAGPGEPADGNGFTGLQGAFTKLLRHVKPTQVFLPTNADLHPDHRIVHSELLISVFHASVDIWPELGEPHPVPYLHELAVYCNFPTPPKLRIHAPAGAMKKKLQAIAEFKSQKQIKAVLNNIRLAGPWEYLRPLEFALYNPLIYRDRFDEPPNMHDLFH